MPLLVGNKPMAFKNLRFVAKVQWFWKKLFLSGWGKLSLILINLIWISQVVKQWTWISSISSTTLPRMTFMSKISVFTCKPRANLNWLFVLGHSLLRPTSNNLKHVLPEILRCLVPECPKSSAWILTPFPPRVWAVKDPWLMHEKLP